MGYSIHLFVEVNKNGIWESVDEWNIEDKDDIYVEYDKQFYNIRNYNLFALLADVCNYHGIEPICSPKGLPLDVSDVVKVCSDLWGVNGHSHSYFTLNELLSFDWGKTIKEAGYMENQQWDLFNASMNTDKPDYNLRIPYSQGIRQTPISTHTWHEWEIPVKVSVGNFYETTIPQLVQLGKPEDVRIVFFFDN